MSVRALAAAIGAALILGWTGVGATLAADRPYGAEVLRNWYLLMNELVRHTATYSPPVASRNFGYIGVTVFEATVGGSDKLVSLVGQLQDLQEVPSRVPSLQYDDAVIINAALSAAIVYYFGNTGPTGQRSIRAAQSRYRALAVDGVPDDVVARSEAFGVAMADAIYDWSLGDGAAEIVNMGFPLDWDLPKGDDKWVPTSLVQQQQYPLLPEWGNKRTFAIPSGATCGVTGHPAYSVDSDSRFYQEAAEVYEIVMAATPEQIAIARFWSDDPMLSMTPPGHWVSIALQVAQHEKLSLEDNVDLLARMGIGMADAFVGCWHEKYAYNLVRPITYIRRNIDPNWDTILNTPPFPEYPSGHSTVSGAMDSVLTAFFGDNYQFEDDTGSPDGRHARTFASFHAAAEEAGISRLYGGIHYRAAIIDGLTQGRCIGDHVNALKTRK